MAPAQDPLLPAGVRRRTVAYLLDVLLVSAVVFAAVAGLSLLTGPGRLRLDLANASPSARVTVVPVVAWVRGLLALGTLWALALLVSTLPNAQRHGVHDRISGSRAVLAPIRHRALPTTA